LRVFLKEKLPEYMTPSAFVVLENLPLSANGKVERGALPDPDAIESEISRDFVGPRNPIEGRVAEIWTELFGDKKISVHDDFFRLGGDSLLAIRLISRLRAEFQMEIAFRNLIEMTTVARQAELIATIQWVIQDAASQTFPGASQTGFIEEEI
jgi:acyl carrier protein